MTLFSNLNKEEKRQCFAQILKQILPNNVLKKHIWQIQQNYPHNILEALQKFDPEEYYMALNEDILSILLMLSGESKETVTYQHIFPIIEGIYRLCEKDFIGIWSFLQNLVTFSSTKNKQACNILGTAIPGSKYSYISSFLNNIENSQQASCPDGDVVFIFDNEQVIGRTWNIRAQNKVKMSIITNVAVVKINGDSNLQVSEPLSPKVWLSSHNQEEVVSEMCETNSHLAEQFIASHYNELYHHLDESINQVVKEMQKDEQSGNWQDFIDKDIEEANNRQGFQNCPNCNCLVDKKKRKCPHCHINMTEYKKRIQNTDTEEVATTMPTEQSAKETAFHIHNKTNEKEKISCMHKRDSQYGHVSSNHSGQSTEVILLDPVFVNPNSIESMLLVLRYIGRKASILKYSASVQQEEKYTRSWTFVCCDGLPHALVRRLIEEYLVCSICKEGFLGYAEAVKHEKQAHPDNKPTFCQEFDWVFLLTGEGHYEMNLMKSFMELNWNIFMKSFAEVMGWKSEKAQQSALNCSDNHKTWQMLNAFHFGSMMELTRPYVEICLREGIEPSAERFISYVKQQSANGNYMYLFETVCRYTQGIINYRVAIRRNNPRLLHSAKWMTKELFHGRNHPKYQEIEIYESFVRNILPNPLKEFFNSFCSISKSGHLSKGQGLDFLLEEENRNVKAWLKRGIPTDETWLSTCRNHQSLKDVKKRVLTLSGQGTSDCSDRELFLQNAINAWRFHLRKSKYIQIEVHGPTLTSLTGEMLNQGLANFTSESNRKRAYRIMDMILHQPPPNDPTLHHPVYIVDVEKEKYESLSALSIPEIDNKILDIIEILEENCKPAFLDLFDRLTKVKSNKKEQHIVFLEEVSAAILHQLPQVDELQRNEGEDGEVETC